MGERLLFWILAGVLAAAAALLAWTYPGHAHSWYGAECCSSQDCEPLPIDGVAEVRTGWRVTYVSPRFGAIDLIVPRGLRRHRRDGGFHGCWRFVDGKVAPICIYVPVNA